MEQEREIESFKSNMLVRVKSMSGENNLKGCLNRIFRKWHTDKQKLDAIKEDAEEALKQVVDDGIKDQMTSTEPPKELDNNPDA